MKSFLFTILGFAIAFALPVLAQLDTSGIEPAPIISPDRRIVDIMASTSVDSLTATQLIYDDHNTKQITERLDKIIRILGKK